MKSRMSPSLLSRTRRHEMHRSIDLLDTGTAMAAPLSLNQAVRRAVTTTSTSPSSTWTTPLPKTPTSRPGVPTSRAWMLVSRSSDLVNFSDPDDPVLGFPCESACAKPCPAVFRFAQLHRDDLRREGPRTRLRLDARPRGLCDPAAAGRRPAPESEVTEARFGMERTPHAGGRDRRSGVRGGERLLVARAVRLRVAAATQSLEGARKQQGWVRERIELGFDAPAGCFPPTRSPSPKPSSRCPGGSSRRRSSVAVPDGHRPHRPGPTHRRDHVGSWNRDECPSGQRPGARRGSLAPTATRPASGGPSAARSALFGGGPTPLARRQCDSSPRSRTGGRLRLVDIRAVLVDAPARHRSDHRDPVGAPEGAAAELRMQDATQATRLEVEAAVRDVEATRARYRLSEQGLISPSGSTTPKSSACPEARA